MRLVTLGVGAQSSPHYAPAGLLVCHQGARIMLDGGPGAAPAGALDAWLVCDAQSELKAELRRLAQARCLEIAVHRFARGDLAITPRVVQHTSHRTFGYLLRTSAVKVVWAPEFLVFPRCQRR